MFIADGHCDTLTEAADKHTGLVKNVLHWDISRASEYDAFIQVLAIFQDSEKTKPSVSQTEYYIKKAEAVQKQAEKFMLARMPNRLKKLLMSVWYAVYWQWKEETALTGISTIYLSFMIWV